MSDPTCKGSASASPTEVLYLRVFGAGLHSIDWNNVGVLVELIFTANFFEPKLLN
jgi:hypothetical protein